MKFTAMKKTVALAGAAAMLVSVAACGGSSNTGSSSTGSSSDKKIELTVWSWDSTLPRTVEGFEKANPNIKVKVTNAGTNKDEYNALSNAIEGGSGAPDIAQIEYYALPEYVIRGYLEDLSDYGASDFSDFYTPGTWASVNINDGVYALPMDSGPMAWFYNKEVFDKAGVDATQVKTWDQFYEAAKKIKAAGSYITSDSGDAGFFDSMTWLAGAKPFSTSKDGKTVSIDLTGDSKVKEFTDFWQKMIDEGLIDTKTVGWTDDWNKGLDDGSIASLLTGAWMPYNLLSGAPNGEGKWRIAQMPTADGSETNSENGGSSLAVIKSDDKDKVAAAYKFMEYACHNAEGIKTRVDGGAFPADNDTLKSSDFLGMTALTDSDGKAHEYFGGQKFNEELAKAAANVSTGYQFLPIEVYARGKFGDFVGDAYTGKGKLADGIAAWQKDLKSYAEGQGYTVK
ncbi:ABC transporter substrate-binding protein [Bifidobacterium sp. UTCIF-37]|uniref:ABC transporter substrate-binding protein n=1 Tax=unclassified Bifidobacterium TaxID=2608897 RepID=UPI00112C992A|nr:MULTISPECIES: extracellular solute-binding protein [unclassified Bifidobacterium]TPF85677.1 ABC transporter substrate-binding protein [Bifidobacterium sp. UTCIF-37]TPF88062.1 ABC transporter substrate-binding protein [Bifidobacterium sp. UTCIF-38]